MKISKVNNTRTGIGVQKQRTAGMIYKTPEKPDARENIKEHIMKLNERAQKLYSPFNNNSIMNHNTYKTKRREEKRFYQEAEKNLKNSCKRFFVNIAKMNDFSEQDIIHKLKASRQEMSRGLETSKDKIIQYLKGNKEMIQNAKIDEIFCEDLIEACLKKTLARNRKSIKRIKEYVAQEEGYNRKDIITKVVKILAGTLPENAMSAKEWEVFYYVIKEDYHKEKQISELVNSFEQKDTKVQVFQVDGEYRLELSNVNNPKKKYISDFIHTYAGSSMEEQKELLIHQRRLLLLYVCGPQKYALAENVDLMTENWGGLLPEEHENMSQEIYHHLMYEDKKLTEQDFNNMCMERYAKAVQTEGLSDEDIKWIGYFNDEVGKIFYKSKNRYKQEKIGSQYIIKQLWKGWTSFIAMKYIDIGKAVYHFAMPQGVNPKDGTPIAYGVVQEPFQNGLTSFDYEQIKAKESISRNLAVYTTFAVNIFSRATTDENYLAKKETVKVGNKEIIKDNSDILFLKKEDYDEALKSNVNRRILQYFGGQSRWEQTGIKGIDGKELFEIMLEELKIARNSNEK